MKTKNERNPTLVATKVGVQYTADNVTEEHTSGGSKKQVRAATYSANIDPSHQSAGGQTASQIPPPTRRSSVTDILAHQREADEKRKGDADHWLEHGSERLDDAWVNVCPCAASNVVKPYKLVEIVDFIRTGEVITVHGHWREEQISLQKNQELIRRLYQSGVDQANAINRLRIGQLLTRLGLHTTDPETVQVLPVRLSESEKASAIGKVIVNGVEFDVQNTLGDVPYLNPCDLGKSRADEAKKRTPGVTLAGFFLPHRNKRHLFRATGLYPLDFDGVDNIEETREKINKDPYAVIVFKSISGSGLRVCVHGPVAKDASQYEVFYKLIAREKSSAWGLEAKLDQATFDISRLTFLPYDPEISFHH